eukprot:3277791-Pyramimonas_sp.AAC.1
MPGTAGALETREIPPALVERLEPWKEAQPKRPRRRQYPGYQKTHGRCRSGYLKAHSARRAGGMS